VPINTFLAQSLGRSKGKEEKGVQEKKRGVIAADSLCQRLGRKGKPSLPETTRGRSENKKGEQKRGRGTRRIPSYWFQG